MAYETGQQLYHRVELEGRDKLTVSGVEDVERFDEGCIVMGHLRGDPDRHRGGAAHRQAEPGRRGAAGGWPGGGPDL